MIKVFFITAAFFLTSMGYAQQDLRLWYQQPAQKWTDALPIGNGALGAMIFGGIEEDHIQFNEETLWTDRPRAHARKDAVEYLQQIRTLLFEGKQKEAEDLAGKHFMGLQSNEEQYPTQKAAWLKKMLSFDAPKDFYFDDKSWNKMRIPTPEGWERSGNEEMDGLDGVVWFRNEFELPQGWEDKDLTIELGRIRDQDETYINGKLVGSDEGMFKKRRYDIDPSVLKKGKNIVSIRVINYYDKGGLTGVKGNDPTFIIYQQGGDRNNFVQLDPDWKYWVQNDTPPEFPRYEASYQPFGDIWIQQESSGKVTRYQRSLDLATSVASVSYRDNGVQYKRAYFASAPDSVLTMHYTANRAGRISVQVGLKSPHKGFSVRRIDDQTIGLFIKVKNGVLKGVSYLHATATKGSVAVDQDRIIVKNADDATFYLTAATTFIDYKNVSGRPELLCQQRINLIKNKTYKDIRQHAVADYQSYFNSFSIDFGTDEKSKLPTDKRIMAFENEFDHGLLSLYVQYARYLMISSSRPKSQPINLQGIWNDLLTPPWDSKYTTNINLEMNYWPVDVLNLSECIEPLVALAEDLSEAGRETAKNNYAAPGWVLHHNTDLWRGTAPINASNHGIWVTGGAWICHNLWDHYLFNGDREYLKRIYPVMKGAAEFFVHFLEDPKSGRLISTPSNSPENGGLVAGPTMDHQIIRDLFKNCITASEILNRDASFRDTLKEKYPKIAPNQIGKFGQLQEWLQDIDDTTNKHRHVSHLWGVYPGTDITWDDPEMMNASRQSLIYRGDDGTGWSLAWKVNLWARYKDGEHAFMLMKKLLRSAEGGTGSERGGVYHNMFDAHPPFQIDGNFGGAAGMMEMLVQSQGDFIEIFPALPTELPEGDVKGLKARGGFVIDITWKEGTLDNLTVRSQNGNTCHLKYKDKSVAIPTTKDGQYVFNKNLELL